MNSGQSELLVAERDGVAWLTFNRAQKANALSLPLLTAFVQALADASNRASVRAVVITGAGDRTFSAGADLSRPAENAETYLVQRRAQFAASLDALLDFKKPVVAAVNGAACGAGMMFALLCDSVIASDAARFSLPEINKGLPALPGVAIVKDRYGSALASDLVLSGRWMKADEAHARGLVREVVPYGDLAATAQKIALVLGAYETRAFAVNKQLLNSALKTSLAAALKASAEFHGHADKS